MAVVFPALPVSIPVQVEAKPQAESLGPPAIVLVVVTTMAVLASAAPILEDPEQAEAVDGMAAAQVVMRELAVVVAM
jgi:hypothetical protein